MLSGDVDSSGRVIKKTKPQIAVSDPMVRREKRSSSFDDGTRSHVAGVGNIGGGGGGGGGGVGPNIGSGGGGGSGMTFNAYAMPHHHLPHHGPSSTLFPTYGSSCHLPNDLNIVI